MLTGATPTRRVQRPRGGDVSTTQIVVTGARGSVGSNLYRSAVERGAEVTALVRSGTDPSPSSCPKSRDGKK